MLCVNSVDSISVCHFCICTSSIMSKSISRVLLFPQQKGRSEIALGIVHIAHLTQLLNTYKTFYAALWTIVV